METGTQVTEFLETLTEQLFFSVPLAYPEYEVVNRSEILRVLERAAHDSGFIANIGDTGRILGSLRELNSPMRQRAQLAPGRLSALLRSDTGSVWPCRFLLCIAPGLIGGPPASTSTSRICR
jgi:hypothetical protein